MHLPIGDLIEAGGAFADIEARRIERMRDILTEFATWRRNAVELAGHAGIGWERAFRALDSAATLHEHGLHAEALTRFRERIEPGATITLPSETWEATDPPRREWIIRDLLPAGRLAALYGAGGAGKSRLALQLAAAVMHGGPPLRPAKAVTNPMTFMAERPVLQDLPMNQQGRVIWLTWEDEAAEVLRRWRMAHHAGAIAAPFPTPDKLTLVDMRKIGGPLWGPERGRYVSTAATWTDAGKEFLATLRGHKLAIIDPLAAAFASSEIDRALVRAFTSALDGEAEAAECAVLLIAHPSKAGGAAGGDGYSGSTDWQASVRAFLSLDTGAVPGGDAKDKKQAYRLRVPKQSYAPDGQPLWLVRHWQAPDAAHNTPAALAWFAAPAEVAADAFEKVASGVGNGNSNNQYPRNEVA